MPMWGATFPANGEHEVIHHTASLRSGNSARLLHFLDGPYNALILENERRIVSFNMSFHVIVWANVTFGRECLETYRQMIAFLPHYSLFLIPVEEFLSARRCKIASPIIRFPWM